MTDIRIEYNFHPPHPVGYVLVPSINILHYLLVIVCYLDKQDQGIQL